MQNQTSTKLEKLWDESNYLVYDSVGKEKCKEKLYMAVKGVLDSRMTDGRHQKLVSLPIRRHSDLQEKSRNDLLTLHY